MPAYASGFFTTPMNERLETLREQMRQLEKDLLQETRASDAAFCQQAHGGVFKFTAEARAAHKKQRVRLPHYVLHSRFMVLLTAPVIWLCLLPIALADAIGTLYQAVCFPIYGIPKVRRSEYLAFDRHHLAYLNFIEKLNCEYCAYVNGVLGYFTEIAARTEQHWCPIKHAGCVKCAHSRYRKFAEYGDATQYREHFEEISHAYQDLKPNSEKAG
jgi:hypothetical protein